MTLPDHLWTEELEAAFEKNRVLMARRLDAIEAEIKVVEDYLISKFMFINCGAGDLYWGEHAGRWRILWEAPGGKKRPAGEAPVAERIMLGYDLSALLKAAAEVALK